jgi:hypothetical protein
MRFDSSNYSSSSGECRYRLVKGLLHIDRHTGSLYVGTSSEQYDAPGYDLQCVVSRAGDTLKLGDGATQLTLHRVQ